MEPEVDVSLIEATLALTPRERLEQNDRVLKMIDELREGFAKADDAARKSRLSNSELTPAGWLEVVNAPRRDQGRGGRRFRLDRRAGGA